MNQTLYFLRHFPKEFSDSVKEKLFRVLKPDFLTTFNALENLDDGGSSGSGSGLLRGFQREDDSAFAKSFGRSLLTECCGESKDEGPDFALQFQHSPVNRSAATSAIIADVFSQQGVVDIFQEEVGNLSEKNTYTDHFGYVKEEIRKSEAIPEGLKKKAEEAYSLFLPFVRVDILDDCRSRDYLDFVDFLVRVEQWVEALYLSGFDHLPAITNAALTNAALNPLGLADAYFDLVRRDPVASSAFESDLVKVVFGGSSAGLHPPEAKRKAVKVFVSHDATVAYLARALGVQSLTEKGIPFAATLKLEYADGGWFVSYFRPSATQLREGVDKIDWSEKLKVKAVNTGSLKVDVRAVAA